jgi:hypothetical protein
VQEDGLAEPADARAGDEGAAMGGGVGLVCVADRVVADQQAVFATPEVTLGIVPAQIAPFVLRRLGDDRCAPIVVFALDHKDRHVRFGAVVTIIDEEGEEEKTYRIVGAYEADMKQGSISISSPLAKALLGRKVGDSVEVPAPGGARSVEITAVAFR